jgi:HrpA-like RNA helicase
MTSSELQRSDLKEFILKLKSMGVKNLQSFETMTKPERNSIARTLENLFYLGLIDENTNLTELGLKVCEIPIDPRLSVSIIKAGHLFFT